MISCILLSAGESLRFGSPKALASLKGQTVIEYICQKLKNSQIAETIIVLGAHKELIEPYLLKHKDIRVVYNNHYKFGQSSSFKCGVETASADAKGFMLLPVDCPFILTETLDRIMAQFECDPQSLLIPSFKRRKGHPPIFPQWLRSEILNMENTLGMNSLIDAHQNKTNIVDFDDPGIVQTFNTPEEWDALVQAI